MRPDLVPVQARSVPGGLHDLAESADADLLVVGAGRSSGRYVHGSPCPVAIAPRGFCEEADAGLRVIGVAYDGSPEATQALGRAESLALRAGAALRIIGVLEPAAGVAVAYGGFYGVGSPAPGRRDLHHTLESAAESVAPATRAQTVMATGSPVEEITRRAGALDLLVSGSRGYGSLRRVLLGGVSAGLVRNAPCPILVVPRSSRGPRQADAPALVASS
jgi:nucleotide-binding universal stress UspA family protein